MVNIILVLYVNYKKMVELDWIIEKIMVQQEQNLNLWVNGQVLVEVLVKI